jgi:hypothetical protein
MNWKIHLAITPFPFSEVTPKVVVVPRVNTNGFEVIFDVIGELGRVHE